MTDLFEGGPTRVEDYPRKVGYIEPAALHRAFGDFPDMYGPSWGDSEDLLLSQFYLHDSPPQELCDLIQIIRPLAALDIGSVSMKFLLTFDTSPVRPHGLQRIGWHRDKQTSMKWHAAVTSELPTEFLVPDPSGEFGELVEECGGHHELLLELFRYRELRDAGFIQQFEPGDIVHFGPSVIHKSGTNTSGVRVDQVFVGLGAY